MTASYDEAEIARQKTRQYRIVAAAILLGLLIVAGSVTTVVATTIRSDRLRPATPDGTVECKYVPRGST